MFTQTWRKYLPVIAILIKKTGTANQTLSMNHTDFERAAGGRKLKYSFTQLHLNKGKLSTEIKISPIAAELAVLLKEDLIMQKIVANYDLIFSLNNDFVLTIKNQNMVVEPEITDEVIAEAEATPMADEEMVTETTEAESTDSTEEPA